MNHPNENTGDTEKGVEGDSEQLLAGDGKGWVFSYLGNAKLASLNAPSRSFTSSSDVFASHFILICIIRRVGGSY